MKTLLIINIIGLTMALIAVTYYFVLFMRTKRKVQELEKKNKLIVGASKR